jgi:serine/threonine protein kinase
MTSTNGIFNKKINSMYDITNGKTSNVADSTVPSILRNSNGTLSDIKTQERRGSKSAKSVGFLLDFAAARSDDDHKPVPSFEELKKAIWSDNLDKKYEFKYPEFKFIRTLGSGGFATVFEAKWLTKNINVAVKVIPKSKLKHNEDSLKMELDILSSVNHPHLLKMYTWGFSKDSCLLVLELAKGGELFDRLAEEISIAERDVSMIIRKILEAVTHLHSLNIVHRDLKPENVLLRSTEKSDYDDIVLADFGLSKILDKTQAFLRTRTGSFGYIAPEVLMSLPYGKPVDIWSIGIIAYSLLTGTMPYNGDGFDEELNDILDHRLDYDAPSWHGVSREAKNFVSSCLKITPSLRPTVEDALQHPWITKWINHSTKKKANHLNHSNTSSSTASSRFSNASDFSRLLPVPGEFQQHDKQHNLLPRVKIGVQKRQDEKRNKEEDPELAKQAKTLLRMSSYDNLSAMSNGCN